MTPSTLFSLIRSTISLATPIYIQYMLSSAYPKVPIIIALLSPFQQGHYAKQIDIQGERFSA